MIDKVGWFIVGLGVLVVIIAYWPVTFGRH